MVYWGWRNTAGVFRSEESNQLTWYADQTRCTQMPRLHPGAAFSAAPRMLPRCSAPSLRSDQTLNRTQFPRRVRNIGSVCLTQLQVTASPPHIHRGGFGPVSCYQTFCLRFLFPQIPRHDTLQARIIPDVKSTKGDFEWQC